MQGLQTKKGDWFQIISDIKEKAAIEKSDEEISKMKKETFKSYVDKKIDVVAFHYLRDLARKHSKSEHYWDQEKLEQQKYLKDMRFSKQEIQMLFALRTRMIYVKTNFRNLYENNLGCQTCDKDDIEDENHLLNCETLKDDESVKSNFEMVYGNVEDQLKIVKIFKKILVL